MALVFVAEFGDKSQLVSMSLATRHRPWPVFFGASCAFALLNALAVAFGEAATRAVPKGWIALLCALLFAFFAWKSFAASAEEEEEESPAEKPGHSIFGTAFLMIFLAEFGDRTQIAAAACAPQHNSWLVWGGCTLGLAANTALGVWAGARLLKRIPMKVVHRISGLLFAVFALVALLAAWRAFPG
ncbi:MAG: hypothetical protein RL095_1249 [Verrucomicrobiota bacterium]